MILNSDKLKISFKKESVDYKKFIDSKDEYVFQEIGKKIKYNVKDNFKTLTYNIKHKKNRISIRGQIEFFEPNIFILTKGSEYYNKHIENKEAFGKFNIDLRREVSKRWSHNRGDYSELSVNICFYAPSGAYGFITGLSSQYHKGDLLGVDGTALKTRFERNDINHDVIDHKNKNNDFGISTMSDNRKYYLILMNNKYYDFEKSKEDGYYYWPMERKKALKWLKNNLTIYIYESSSKKINYKCELIEKELLEDNDKSLSNLELTYVIKKSSNNPIKDKVFIKLGNFVDSKENQLLELKSLKENGLNTIRKSQDISKKEKLWKYLELMFNDKDVNNNFYDSESIDGNEIKRRWAKIISCSKNPNDKEYFKTKSEQISNILRKDYRERLFNRNKRYNDVNNEEFDELSMNKENLFEAAHIVDVQYIKKFLIENEKNLINSINLENIKPDLDLMLSEKNGIFIPFKYHYYFDNDIIYLNSKLEFKVNKKFEKTMEIFNEEFFDLKRELLDNKEIIRLVELRNKYRKI